MNALQDFPGKQLERDKRVLILDTKLANQLIIFLSWLRCCNVKGLHRISKLRLENRKNLISPFVTWSPRKKPSTFRNWCFNETENCIEKKNQIRCLIHQNETIAQSSTASIYAALFSILNDILHTRLNGEFTIHFQFLWLPFFCATYRGFGNCKRVLEPLTAATINLLISVLSFPFVCPYHCQDAFKTRFDLEKNERLILRCFYRSRFRMSEIQLIIGGVG